VSTVVAKALCLHAAAEDLKFLNPVRNRMAKLLGNRFRGFCFGDQSSVNDARIALTRSEGSLIVIFAHGGSDYVRGGEYVHRVTREVIEAKKFLTLEDMNLFRGNAVFCMSCDSNGLASTSLAAGAKAFVGFNEIPFNRYDARGKLVTNREFEQHAQKLLANATKCCIERFLSGQMTLEESVGFLRLCVCQHAVQFVRRFPSLKPRREIAALLLRMKEGVRYYGEADVRFVG